MTNDQRITGTGSEGLAADAGPSRRHGRLWSLVIGHWSLAVQGRLCVVGAALLWSTSGAFTKVLREDTGLGLNEPQLAPLQIAFFRVFFAGLVLVPFLRRGDISFRPAMLPTVLSFAVMNALFVSALALGSAANAIVLQYTAPMWMYLAAVWFLGEPADRRGAVSLGIGLAGIAVIVWGALAGPRAPSPGQGHPALVVAIALGSGVAYAGVLIGLRVLRDASPRWLTVVNHLGGALALAPFVWGYPVPTGPQFVVLFAYGALQMGLPYWLVARGLRTVSPQEAGTLTLLEPILNPLWAYLASPATEKLSPFTLAGGAFILGALAYRYWPFARGDRLT
jgi:drug/metabolite transporter (DMT)-like permease